MDQRPDGAASGCAPAVPTAYVSDSVSSRGGAELKPSSEISEQTGMSRKSGGLVCVQGLSSLVA